MIDRKARDQMARAIRSYLDEEISAFKFDEALAQASNATEDRTVQTVARALWFLYDDCKDHKIVASKEEWDYFNRLLLLIESGGEMETVRSWRKWHPFQAVAAVLFLTFLLIAVRVGWGEHLIAYALPFGPASMLLAWLNSRRYRKEVHAIASALTPFPSVGNLLAIRRHVSGFGRHRYPKAIVARRIRDPIIDRLMWVPWSLAWCMFSPVALFLQMLPNRDSEIRIQIPEPSAGVNGLTPVTQP